MRGKMWGRFYFERGLTHNGGISGLYGDSSSSFRLILGK
jgi:hypothetical protein